MSDEQEKRRLEEGEVEESDESEEHDEESSEESGDENSGEDEEPSTESHEADPRSGEAANPSRVRRTVGVDARFLDLLSNFRKYVRYMNHPFSSHVELDREWSRVVNDVYSDSLLPTEDQIKRHIKDEKFLKIYGQRYFAHLYEKTTPTVTDRLKSFVNFLGLFDMLLKLSHEKPELDLSIQWVADMIEEFINQFAEFHNFRWNSNTSSLSSEDAKYLESTAWALRTVEEYLRALAKKGGIDLSLLHKQGTPPVAPKHGISELYRALSQFSLIGLSRVHCMLGDYHSALRVLDSIDLSSSGRHSPVHHVPSIKMTLHYNAAFSYFMLCRYTDSAKSLEILHRPNYRSKKGSQFTPSHHPYYKHMRNLLSLVYKLSPQSVDLSPQSVDHELSEEIKAQSSESAEELFNNAAPDFIDPSPPDFSELVSTSSGDNRPAFKQQKKIFLEEYKQRQNVPVVYQEMKMCTNVDTERFSKFLEKDGAELTDGKKQDATFALLMKLKNKSRSLRWQSGLPLSRGKPDSTAEVNFLVDEEVVTMKDPIAQENYSEYFVQQILKQQDIYERLYMGSDYY